MNHGDALVSGSHPFCSPTRSVAVKTALGTRPDQADRLESALLRELVEQLQARERSRTEWTALVVHELRRPLTTIDLSAQLLEELLAADSGQIGERLELIRWGIKALASLTKDLLDATSVEAHALKIEPARVRIASLVRDGIAHLPDLGDRCQLRVEPDADVELDADSLRIDQVLGNLLENAVKYGDTSSKIDVDVVRQEGQVRVTVSSRGPGIPAARLSRIFDRFERGTQAGTDKPGLGLGLYIAKGIVEAHGGRIWVRSAPGVITQFYFTLPFTATP